MNKEQNDTETKQKLAKATEQLTKAHETIGTMIDQIGMLQLKDKATTEQRDRLAAALTKIQGVGLVAVDAYDELDRIDEIVDEALQSLDQNETSPSVGATENDHE